MAMFRKVLGDVDRAESRMLTTVTPDVKLNAAPPTAAQRCTMPSTGKGAHRVMGQSSCHGDHGHETSDTTVHRRSHQDTRAIRVPAVTNSRPTASRVLATADTRFNVGDGAHEFNTNQHRGSVLLSLGRHE